MNEVLNFKIISTEEHSSYKKGKINNNPPTLGSVLKESGNVTINDVSKITAPIKFFNITSEKIDTDTNKSSATNSGDISGWHKHLIDNNIEFKTITENFLNMVRNDVFESGYSSNSEIFFKSMLTKDPNITRNWLNSVYLKYFYDVKILVGILHIISHIDYDLIFPEGQTMAVASLTHQDVEVREYALKAFENWGHPDSLTILKNINCGERWLQEYLEDIISDLEEE